MNVHRKLIIRLLLAWILLSILIGAAVFFLEMRKIDVFDALTSRRPYKEPFALETAMRILMESRGGHFDPMLIDAFAGITGSLYGEISGADDKLLEDRLDGLIDRYFSMGLQESVPG